MVRSAFLFVWISASSSNSIALNTTSCRAKIGKGDVQQKQHKKETKKELQKHTTVGIRQWSPT
jgi:hypothetical protein